MFRTLRNIVCATIITQAPGKGNHFFHFFTIFLQRYYEAGQEWGKMLKYAKKEE